VAINSNGWFRSGELQSGNSVKVATVAGKQYATVADHDPGDETVGHADGIARALGRFANIAGSVSRVVVQFERWHCREKLRKTGKLFRVPGSREKFESRDNSGSERLTLEQQIYGVGCAFACEKSIRTSVSAMITASSAGFPGLPRTERGLPSSAWNL
jgi:hypothetical protein